MWRFWILLSGAPVGALAALAAPFDASPAQLLLSGVGFGLGLAALASGVERARSDDPERGRHLAAAASAGWVGLPGIGATLWVLPPGPLAWTLGLLGVLAVALARGARVRAPAGGPLRWLGYAIGSAVVGGVFEVALVTSLAGGDVRLSSSSAAPEPPPSGAAPRCSDRVRSTSTLLGRGAHPYLDAAGRRLWFDATDTLGVRQVHRLDLETGELVCWTCGEPGHNVRPAVSPSGVVFETDRYRSWRTPVNREIQLAPAQGERPVRPSRRMTFGSGPDLHPLLTSDGRELVWARRRGGRADVVSAPLLSGHGGTILGRVRVVASAGSGWMVPAALSTDHRSLVLRYGNPFGPVRGMTLDLATGERADLEPVAVKGAASAFRGRHLLLSTAKRESPLGLLPESLGFLLGPWAAQRSLHDPLHRGTTVQLGAGERRVVVRLGEASRWGEPTGVSWRPEGTAFVLGQRRRTRSGVEERLLLVELDCS